jgi:hypothetical protein
VAVTNLHYEKLANGFSSASEALPNLITSQRPDAKKLKGV